MFTVDPYECKEACTISRGRDITNGYGSWVCFKSPIPSKGKPACLVLAKFARLGSAGFGGLPEKTVGGSLRGQSSKV